MANGEELKKKNGCYGNGKYFSGGVFLSQEINFDCEIEREIYNAPDYKIYGAYVDIKQYPDVRLNKYDNVTLVGNFHDLTIGVKYNVKAIEGNSKYGIQYEVINIKRDIPTSASETAKFLHEILTYNQASVLLEVYPNIVQKIINNDLDDIDLSKTKGIKEATFEVIKNKIIENFALVEVVDKYGGYGITMSMLKKLYDNYASIQKLEEALQKDPYKALCGISGIGFKKADNIILSLPRNLLNVNYDMRTSAQRMKSCILHILEDNESDGNTRMDIRELRKECMQLAPECVHHFVDVIKNSNSIYLNVDTKQVARTIAYETELYIANTIKSMLESPRVYDFNYHIYHNIDDKELTDQQLNALKNLCENNISLLCGLAGAGKSFTTQAIIKMLDDNGLSYVLLAPTGKASKVLADFTDRDASTIHRGLAYHPMMGWGYNKDNKLLCDVVICDETGMVDIYLMRHLLEAIDVKKTKILFIQDPAQLPSVGCGNCSNDMIQSKQIPTTTLDKVFRYGEGGLYNVATKVRNGEYYIPDNSNAVISFGKYKDYTLLTMPQEEVNNAIANLYEKLLKDGATIDDIMVLSHHNKGDYGSKILNNLIQSRINPSNGKKSIKYGQTTFIVRDKVLQVVNNYQVKTINDDITQVFNGNTGIIKDIVGNDTIIEFDDELVVYSKDELSQLLLGYAMSIHKSQGDAAKYVIITTPKAHTFFINRNLLYTGITRTREKCYHFSSKELIKSSLKKSAIKERKTFLKEMLCPQN
jgi:exodeoxyribonuclease V alpha subunit